MNSSCEFAGGGYCLCDACQAARKALEDAEKITKEEVDRIFCDAEKMFEDMKTQEQEDK